MNQSQASHVTCRAYASTGPTILDPQQLLIKPAKKSIKSLLDKVREVIKGNASVTQEALIRRLNPIIRRWTMYHRHVVAKATFSTIDSHIWHLLWKWARRRHPTKGARWAVTYASH